MQFTQQAKKKATELKTFWGFENFGVKVVKHDNNNVDGGKADIVHLKSSAFELED